MSPQRRTFLRLAGLGAVTTLAGCSDPTEPGEDGSADAIAGVDSRPFVTHSGSPVRDGADTVGRAVLVDSEARERAVFDQYDAGERRDEFEDFLADLDYERERLLIAESVGPDACHDRLDVSNVRPVAGELRAEATVVDTGEDGTACAEVLTYPSAVVRISFEAGTAPADSAAVEMTDGWDETATVSATVDDPLDPDLESLEGSIRPEAEADPLEPLECGRSNVHRHPQAFDSENLRWGNFWHEGWVPLGLRIDDTAYEYGDTTRIELTNVTDESVYTGNSAKYNIQAYTGDGWQDLRVADEDQHFGYEDDAVEHPPGEGFEWSFELTEAGITADTFHDHAEVCPDLAAGRYRFAFFGITDGAVAVAFDLRL